MLRACDRLNPEPLGPLQLASIASDLGSDVPFLAGEAPAARGRGRGERLETVPAMPAMDVALVFPSFGVSTKDAYRWLAESRGDRPTRAATMDREHAGSWESLAAHARNDFEPVVAARHPAIDAMLHALRSAGAMLAMMSGSGSTVFGVFTPDAATRGRSALAARGALPPGSRVVWTRTAARVVPIVVSG